MAKITVFLITLLIILIELSLHFQWAKSEIKNKVFNVIEASEVLFVLYRREY